MGKATPGKEIQVTGSDGVVSRQLTKAPTLIFIDASTLILTTPPFVGTTMDDLLTADDAAIPPHNHSQTLAVAEQPTHSGSGRRLLCKVFLEEESVSRSARECVSVHIPSL